MIIGILSFYLTYFREQKCRNIFVCFLVQTKPFGGEIEDTYQKDISKLTDLYNINSFDAGTGAGLRVEGVGGSYPPIVSSSVHKPYSNWGRTDYSHLFLLAPPKFFHLPASLNYSTSEVRLASKLKNLYIKE